MRLWPIQPINDGDHEHFNVSEMCISQIVVDLFPFTYLLLFSLLPTRLEPHLTKQVTCEMSYKKLLTLHENPCSLPVFGEVHVAHPFSILCRFCFVYFRFVSCVQCCFSLWIFHSGLLHRFSLVFIDSFLMNYVIKLVKRKKSQIL